MQFVVTFILAILHDPWTLYIVWSISELFYWHDNLRHPLSSLPSVHSSAFPLHRKVEEIHSPLLQRNWLELHGTAPVIIIRSITDNRKQLSVIQPPLTSDRVNLIPRPTLFFCSLDCIDYNTWKQKSSEKTGKAWENSSRELTPLVQTLDSVDNLICSASV